MAIKSLFFDAVKSGDVYDRTYDSEDFCSWLDLIVGDGVFPLPSTNLQVRADSGMQVIIQAGQGWIKGHKMLNTADYPVQLDPANALLNRFDRIIFYCDWQQRELGISVLTGTPAATPTVPELTRTATRYEMSLAVISVPKQTTEITNALITDTRADSNVCGWVAGLIQQVDTSTLFQQWQTAYTNYYADIIRQVDEFMQTLTQELKVNTYLVEYKKSVSGTYGNQNLDIPLDMTNYHYGGTDVIFVFINGLKADPAQGDYSLIVSGGNATVRIPFTYANNSYQEIEIKVLKTRIGIDTIVDQYGNHIVDSQGNNISG